MLVVLLVPHVRASAWGRRRVGAADTKPCGRFARHGFSGTSVDWLTDCPHEGGRLSGTFQRLLTSKTTTVASKSTATCRVSTTVAMLVGRGAHTAVG